MTKRTTKTRLAKQPTTTPAPKAPTVPAADIPHAFRLMASIYRHHMERLGGEEKNPLAQDSAKFIFDLMERFKARDPVEELLFSQMMLTHGRMIYLTGHADQQSNIKWATLMHEAADRAANTFRRQMLALAEYRRPPRAKSFTAIGQANIAQQQVVQNRISENAKTSNEQGSHPPAGASNQAALPPVTSGTASTSGVGAPEHAVAEELQPEDRSGETPGEHERPAAR